MANFVDTLDFTDLNIRTINTEIGVLYYASDLANILNIGQVNLSIKNFDSSEVVSYKTRKEHSIITYKKYKDGMRRNNSVILLTNRGVWRLICTSRSIHANALAKKLGIDVHTRIAPVESSTIADIVRVFKNHKYYTQYNVGKYKIDLYFIDHKLAVECDETNHADRNVDYEKTRQETIEGVLGCRFIRYNPNAADFNILDVIAEIHNDIAN